MCVCVFSTLLFPSFPLDCWGSELCLPSNTVFVCVSVYLQGKEYDPYGGRVTIEQSCPKKLANVLSLTTGDELSPRSLRLWEGFIMDLSSVVDMFQDISEDTFLPLFCFCFPCFLVWRSNYLARARSRMLESFVQRHHLSFESAGLLLRYKDITAHLNDCCLDVAQKVTVVEIIWDPSLWTDRI